MPNVAKMNTCKTCGKGFIITSDRNTTDYCRICSKAWYKKKEREKTEADNQKWQDKREKDQALFEHKICNYCLMPMDELKPTAHSLYVIGNGFDLMHQVPSSYYSFKESIKNSFLLEMLEITLTPEDIWADFEESLGKLNLDQMGGRHIVDMWLDYCGYYSDEDPTAAQFYMAVETAANPIISITNELQPAFRKWVERLTIGTEDRPLKDLINSEGKVLCFNYTEFIETLYGSKDVCYIHGCRTKKKERLVLGHRPRVQGVLYEKRRKAKTYRQALVDIARDNVFDLIEQYDEELTKNSSEIINANQEFFKSLAEIDEIIVLGHSMSPVDFDYFSEISRNTPTAKWYFGCHSLRDLQNMDELIKRLGIDNYCVFRTDGIRTKPLEKPVIEKPKPRLEIQRFTSGDTEVVIQSYVLKITEQDNPQLELVLPHLVKKVVFAGESMFLLMDDLDRNILLFSHHNGKWVFIDELLSFEHQSLVNRRLKHVLVTRKDILFVYNNRVRRYDLLTGQMIENQQIRGAKDRAYPGTEVIALFIGR